VADEAKWAKRFELVIGFAWMFAAGFLLMLFALMTPGVVRVILLVCGVLALFPGMIYIYVVTQWHWKERYRGRHSDLWGAVLLIETSGWMKLVYFFRHLLPDARNSGRYRRSIAAQQGLESLQAKYGDPSPLAQDDAAF